MKMKTKVKEKVKITKKKAPEDEDEDEEDKEGIEEKGESEEELESNIEDAEEDVEKLKDFLDEDEEVERAVVKGSKPISSLKKGDKIKVDGKEYEVDAHYVLINHGKTKEMTIEIFDKKTDKDYQLRYFSDQIETSMEFYALEEIVYVRKPFQKVEW